MSARRLHLSSTRLAVLYVALFAAGISAVLVTVYFLTMRVLDREIETVIRGEIQGLAEDYQEGGLARLARTLARRSDNWGRIGAVYLLTDPNGTPIVGNLSRWPHERHEHSVAGDFEIEAQEDDRIVTHPVRAVTLKLPSGHRLLVGTDILERTHFLERLRAAMLWSTGLATFLAALIGFGYSRRVRARVGAIAATCEAIIAGELTRRLPIDGSHDEFDELAAAINHMLDRLEQQTATLRATFDSAAHDLRTPLYRVRMRIEETLQHPQLAAEARVTMEATLAELERMQRTLGTLLQIAMADVRGRELATDRIDLAALATEIVDLYRPEAASRGIQLDFVGEAGRTIRGNRQLLAQVLVNLIENALKHVPAGGHVQVRAGMRDDYATLEVADDGPGIPAEHRERVLQPFVRLAQERNGSGGSGLGLSLVAAVMRLHGSSVELLDNQPGLLVRCRFPVPQEPAEGSQLEQVRQGRS